MVGGAKAIVGSTIIKGSFRMLNTLKGLCDNPYKCMILQVVKS